MKYRDVIAEIVGTDGKRYLIEERLFYEDDDIYYDNIVDVQEISKIEIKSTEDRIADLESRIVELEKLEIRILELESK